MGVGPKTAALIVSEPFRDFGYDHGEVWLHATPDIDGDGVSEIALAVAGQPGDFEHAAIFLYRLSSEAGATALIPVVEWCGTGCQPIPWNGVLRGNKSENGQTITDGYYCGPLKAPGADPSETGFVEWESHDGERPRTVYANLTHLGADGVIRFVEEVSYQVPSSAELPSRISDPLCGSPVFEPAP